MGQPYWMTCHATNMTEFYLFLESKNWHLLLCGFYGHVTSW